MIIDGIEYNDVEVAWAAGIFEGEGCVYANKKTGIGCQVVMTDLDIIQRVHAIVKVGKVTGPNRQKSYKAYYKDHYAWRTYRKKDVEFIYKLFGPYLGVRRTTKFESLKHRFKNCMFGMKRGRTGAALDNITLTNSV